jgi:hypothetical protein
MRGEDAEPGGEGLLTLDPASGSFNAGEQPKRARCGNRHTRECRSGVRCRCASRTRPRRGGGSRRSPSTTGTPLRGPRRGGSALPLGAAQIVVTPVTTVLLSTCPYKTDLAGRTHQNPPCRRSSDRAWFAGCREGKERSIFPRGGRGPRGEKGAAPSGAASMFQRSQTLITVARQG